MVREPNPPPHPLRFLVISRTSTSLMGVGASHQCPLGSVTSFLIYADVGLHILLTHRNDRYTFEGYYALWTQIASHGFVIAAPRSCSMGCKAGGWRTYYSEQLKTIDWVKNSSAMLPPKPFSLIDWTPGVGIVGHSMGGEATIRSAQAIYTRPRNIRAAMLHHPFVGPGDFGSKIAVPIAAFTGTADNICYPNETVKVFDAVPATVPKMLRNQVGIDHLEPVLIPPIENEYLGTYTAAWFKVWLLNETGDYKTMIYGNRANYSLCDSAPMAPNGCRFS